MELPGGKFYPFLVRGVLCFGEWMPFHTTERVNIVTGY